jgi:DNA-binding response OmpR family regulator
MEKKKIMIVEDDKELLEELQETLVSVGYEVRPVNDPTTALDEAKKIILLDLKMPKKSGFQIADELRQLSEFTKIPVIAMTGFFTSEEYSLLMNICRIKKCLKKPLNPAQVIEQIEMTLANKQ